ncbi:MAG: hypothetical protein C4547_13560 [Phycisphaerales bacterium]|nr:MAG: hypothetical protein C4547_13560 [Phycisphaerales bacterium]
MNPNKDLTIGVLSVTALILLVGLVIVQTRPAPAFAAGMTTSGGDYVMSIGKVQRSSPDDLLYVIDTVEEKMIAYTCDVNRRELKMTDAVDLKKLREAAKAPQQPTPPRGTPPPQRGRPRP